MTLPIAIMAGGLGTRLRPITEKIPKALVPVAGKPFAWHQLELLKCNGYNEAVFCVGYLGQAIEASLGDGSRWDMNLRYSYDGAMPLGIGGALRKALPLLESQFLVLYGDSYLDCDYQALEKAFVAGGKAGLMSVLRNDNRWGRSNVLFDDGRVLAHDKDNPRPDMRHIDYGLGAFKAEAFETYPLESPLDLATVYQDLLTRGQLAAYEIHRRFYEIGSPEGLQETAQYLLKKGATS